MNLHMWFKLIMDGNLAKLNLREKLAIVKYLIIGAYQSLLHSNIISMR